MLNIKDILPEDIIISIMNEMNFGSVNKLYYILLYGYLMNLPPYLFEKEIRRAADRPGKEAPGGHTDLSALS